MGETKENAQELLLQEEANYAHVDFTDDFMFAYVMQRSDICLELLEQLSVNVHNRLWNHE